MPGHPEGPKGPRIQTKQTTTRILGHWWVFVCVRGVGGTLVGVCVCARGTPGEGYTYGAGMTWPPAEQCCRARNLEVQHRCVPT
jgi:hypothetical protein